MSPVWYIYLELKTETAPTKAQVLAGPSVQLTTSDAVQKFILMD
jgi:hypothetical protein